MRFPNTIIFTLLLCLTFSCAKDIEQKDTIQSGLMSRQELDDVIRDQMGHDQLFYWKNVSANMIWSAALQSDSMVAVGYTINGQKDIKDIIHLVDVKSSNWTTSMEELLALILSNEQVERKNTNLKLEDILPAHLNGNSPSVMAQITSLKTIQTLRDMENVRYVEPSGYSLLEASYRSDSGCSNEPDYSIHPDDYIAATIPTAKIPWNFVEHQITQAWGHTSGAGQKIAVLDTGMPYQQDNLKSNFNSGNSSGRSVYAASTKWSGALWWAELDSPNDQCGHGASMAGTAAAPWSNDGNAVGVAFNADLLMVRSVDDVVITTSNESDGVRDALYMAGDDDARIISMSIGDPFYNSTVADGVYYAYNQGDIILCAAGTSFSGTTWYGVVFPASMPETLAITGVKEGESLVACDACHDGSEVDFVITMERNVNADRHPIALALHSDQPSYIGGSSVATSTMAGITALTWSAHPGDTRAQIIERLKNASSIYPNRDNSFGWGRVNALTAVQ